MCFRARTSDWQGALGGDCRARQLVGLLIAGIARMAAHPEPFDFMSGGERIEAAPQILILHRFLGGGAPAIALPAMHPARNTVADIGRIGEYPHAAAAFQRLQRHDRRGQFHAVIGRGHIAAGKRFLGITGAQHNAPAPWARIAATGPVGIGDHQAGRSSGFRQ